MKAIAKMETPNILDVFQVTSKSSATSHHQKKTQFTPLLLPPGSFPCWISQSHRTVSSDVDSWVDPKPAHWICSGYQGHHLGKIKCSKNIRVEVQETLLNIYSYIYIHSMYHNHPSYYISLDTNVWLFWCFSPKNAVDMLDFCYNTSVRTLFEWDWCINNATTPYQTCSYVAYLWAGVVWRSCPPPLGHCAFQSDGSSLRDCHIMKCMVSYMVLQNAVYVYLDLFIV